MNKTEKKKTTARVRPSQNRAMFHVLIAGFGALAVVLVLLLCLISKDRTFSDSENRSLAQKPALTLSGLKDGSFTSDLDDWFADQFIARDSWISLHLSENRTLGLREVSGVYLCKADYLMERPTTADPETLDRTVGAINDFTAQNDTLNFYALIVPSAATIMTDRLPANTPVPDQLSDIEALKNSLSAKITWLDAVSVLQEHSSEELYYHTDHHWTSLGAYDTFMGTASRMGISPIADYNIYTVTDRFLGTLGSRSGSTGYLDSIQVYDPVGTDVEYLVSIPDTGVKSCSIYNRECLDEKDKYTVFFGGNHPLVEISTTANNDKNLLIFKDSYANSYIQFLIPYYEKIIMVDPRYYYDNVAAVVSGYHITDVLFLYSADQFLADTSLTDVLQSSETEPAEPPADSDAASTESAPADSEADSSEESAVETTAE